jgi:hypothetical protein
MFKHFVLVVVCVLLYTLPTQYLFANDGVASVHGQNLAPISGEDNNIRLVREILNINIKADGYAYVDVTFYLKNDSANPVSIWTGFPDERRLYHELYDREFAGSDLTPKEIDDELLYGYSGYAGWIEDFTAEVNGSPVEWNVKYQHVSLDQDRVSAVLDKYWNSEKLDEEFPYNLGPELLNLYNVGGSEFDIPWNAIKLDFQPNEEKRVHHTYRAVQGSSIGFAPHFTVSFDYTLVTGRSWKGKIDELVVTAKLDKDLDVEWIVGDPIDEWRSTGDAVEYIEDYYLQYISTTEWLNKLDGRTLAGIKHNWEPSSSDTPILNLIAWSEEYYWKEDGIFPNSSIELIPDKEIAKAPLSYLRGGRFEIYARHGRPFTEDDGSVYWYVTGTDWYVPDPDYVIPGDDINRLNDIEKSNAERLLAEENKRRCTE